jgi:hypothetical protein
MVAEMSKHNAEYIMDEMPYARGLQFRTKYWESKGIECEQIGSEQPSVNRVMQ